MRIRRRITANDGGEPVRRATPVVNRIVQSDLAVHYHMGAALERGTRRMRLMKDAISPHLSTTTEQPEHSELRDLASWEAIRSGDAAAFERLFRAHATDLADFALSYVGDPDAAQEIVHVLFCWLWDHRHALDTPLTIRGYLFTAVRNRALNHIRDERTRAAFLSRLAASEPAAVLGTVPAADSAVIGSNLEAAIGRAIAELPTRCREVFTLVRGQGLSHAETARILQIAPKTVEVHMTRALKLLRSNLASWL